MVMGRVVLSICQEGRTRDSPWGKCEAQEPIVSWLGRASLVQSAGQSSHAGESQL
jgi:hypothetical protein